MTESISNQRHTIDSFASQIQHSTESASGIKNANPEESVLYASHTYRDLSAAAEQLGDEGKLLLEIGTLFIEANALLTQLSYLENQKDKKINAKLADRKEPIVKSLEAVKKKIAELEQKTENKATLKELRKNEKFKPLFDQQSAIREKLLEQTKGDTPGAESKRESKEEGVVTELVETAEVPTNVVVTGIGVVKRLDAVLHTKLHTPDELTRTGNAQVFKMGLVISFLAIPFLAVSAFNSMAQVGKTILKASDIKGQLKEIQRQKGDLNIRLSLVKHEQQEQSLQKEPALTTQLVHTRNELERSLEKLSAEEVKLQKKLEGTPLTAALRSVPVVGTLTELSGRVLEVVKIFFEHGARLSAGTIGHISVALHALGPIAAAISTIISGAMLKGAIKKLGNLNEKNEKLKDQIKDAESRMNPYRLHLKNEIEGFRAELAIKKLSPERRKELEASIKEHQETLVDFPNDDVVENFFEMEADRLKVEFLANTRDISLMRLAVANSAFLTLGGMFGFAATIGSPAFAVTTSLYGVALTLLGVSLGLSLAHYIKSKRTAKSLLIKQEPYKLPEKILDQNSNAIAQALITPYKETDPFKIQELVNPRKDILKEHDTFRTDDLKPDQTARDIQTIKTKKEAVFVMWDRLTERNPTLNNPSPEQRYSPEFIQDAIKKHFSSIQQQPESKKTPA